MHIPRNIHKIIELLIINCYIGKREKVRFHYQCKHRHCTACTQTMAENNGKSMETPALKATIPEKLGKCFLYFPSHCNVFVHFRGHHCKGTPPEKMRNCRRAKGLAELWWPAWAQSQSHRQPHWRVMLQGKKTFIITYTGCPENYSWLFNIWKKLCKSSQQDLLKLVARGYRERYPDDRKGPNCQNSLEWTLVSRFRT